MNTDLTAWKKLCRTIGLRGVGAEVFEEVYKDLIRRYSESHRYYHNLDHIEYCFKQYAIYNPRVTDNEQRSANLACGTLLALGCTTAFCRSVYDLILATRHISAPIEPRAKLIVDVDLSSLGASEKVFDTNRLVIRKEYAHLSDAEFEKGNQAFLKTLLARPTIYSLPYFKNKYEAQARRNIQRVLGL